MWLAWIKCDRTNVCSNRHGRVSSPPKGARLFQSLSRMQCMDHWIISSCASGEKTLWCKTRPLHQLEVNWDVNPEERLRDVCGLMSNESGHFTAPRMVLRNPQGLQWNIIVFIARWTTHACLQTLCITKNKHTRDSFPPGKHFQTAEMQLWIGFQRVNVSVRATKVTKEDRKWHNKPQ